MGSKSAALMLILGCLLLISSAKSEKLKVGFYDETCPHAEEIVREAVNKFVSINSGLAAGLIRMHFHDCFVRGCDGSLLLDSVPGHPLAEKDNVANNPSLRGFEVIDEAKARVEEACPKTVSCADILAFAARDSSLTAGYIGYGVPSGRRDGRISLSDDVLQGNIPPPSLSADQLRDNFNNKGLSLDEMVTLSGSHSIGVSHCSAFSSRLSGFNATFDQDPSLHPGFAASLRTSCGSGSGSDPFVFNDFQTPTVLDNKYYGNLIHGKGVLTSDQTLFDSSLTRNLVVGNAQYGSVWAQNFAAAMIKMGKIDVLTGEEGEIRKKCRFIN
ncbi:hypothetical protein ACS0TY_005069 [Phlomoides rotata]